MFRTKHAILSAVTALLAGSAAAGAQTFEQAGVRALGLGGAFVAVADDASAVWWNPAALASGPFFNLVLERQVREREPSGTLESLERSAVDQSVTGFALATPPLGLSYYRTRYTFAPAGSAANGRETEGSGVASLVAHQTGITLLHSVTTGLVVGSTVKFVRGIASLGDVAGGSDADDVLDAAADLIGRATNRLDADLGIHWSAGAVRTGLTLRNLSEPSFSTPDGRELVLERQARAGVAVAVGQSTTIAADLDLLEQTEDPKSRRLAFGIEHRWLPRLALRAGVRATTGDLVDRVASLGGSVAVRSGVWVDGFWSGGEFDDRRWGLAARVVY